MDAEYYGEPSENQIQVKRKRANPLPYIIVFFFLFLISLVALTWMLGVFYKSHACSGNPNIWCSNTWTCNNVCKGDDNPINPQGANVNACFGNTGFGTTGLADCLFGPTAMGSQVCFNAPTGSDTGAVSCDCPTGMQQIRNCFNSCPQNLQDLSSGTAGICGCNDTTSNPACINTSST